MKYGIKNKIAKRLNISHSAVSQWFSSKTYPSVPKMKIMEDDFNIPFTAWINIKKYIKENAN
jgi:transcriptional regulator with XRE-family HTH domain